MNIVTVQLDKKRTIMIGFDALKKFKAITGKSLTKIDLDNEDELEDVIPTVIHVGLLAEDPTLTLDKTIQLIDSSIGVKGAIELFPEIMKATFPEAPEQAKNA